jgi:hypothetical protein
MKDLDFFSGKFFEFQIPKEKRYLLKYFKSDLQINFLKYYMIFRNTKNFSNHTGYKCSESLKKKLEKRFNDLVELYDKSKTSFTEEGLQTIQLIESGKFKLSNFKKG